MSRYSFDDLLLRERAIYIWGIGGGAALLLLSAVLWWNYTSVNPQRVFFGTIENALATRGVTMQSVQTNETSRSNQYLQVQFGADPKARSLTELTQGKAVVKTENLSTPQGDYTRYVRINADKKSKNGKPLDTSRILGVWAQTGNGRQNADKNTPQVFGQTLLSLSLPFGNLSNSQRRTLMQEVHDDNLYDNTTQKVKKQRVHGNLQYVYTVKLQPILYLRFMKNYAKMMGLHELDSVDPNTYSGAKPITVQWTVDAHARQLVGVDYGNGHKESYSGYGIGMTATPPAHPISSSELQKRLSQVQ